MKFQVNLFSLPLPTRPDERARPGRRQKSCGAPAGFVEFVRSAGADRGLEATPAAAA